MWSLQKAAAGSVPQKAATLPTAAPPVAAAAEEDIWGADIDFAAIEAAALQQAVRQAVVD